MPLTVKQVEKLIEPGRYRDQHGLYLQVVAPTNRSWLFRYERKGRERWMGLGPLHTFTLQEARERARRARQQLADGIDPIDARDAERAARALDRAKSLSFRQAALQYFEAHERKWRNAKHRAQFLSTLETYVFPVIGDLPVSAIDTGLVLKCIDSIWQTKTETASRVRGRVERVLDWAMVRGYRTGENPARWKGHLSEVLPSRSQLAKVEHHAALPYHEIPAFVKDLRERTGIAALALGFTILTAARTGEIVGARWSEIDRGNRIWTIPADRMKASREHRVPLSEAAMSILEALPREAQFVFPGGRKGAPISNMAMATLLRRMGRADITVHGFRSTFRDWAAERTSFPNHVVEMALAHLIGDKVEAAYRRGDLLEKRRHLMASWSEYTQLGGNKPTTTVVPFEGSVTSI